MKRFLVMGVLAATMMATFPPLTGAAKKPAAGDNEELYKELELFEHALSIVRADYVESRNLSR